MRNSHSTITLESMSQAVWYNRWTLNKFKKYLSGEILEVGCGIGNFTKSLREYGSLYAIDIDENYINEVKKLVNVKAGLGNIEIGRYFFGDKLFDSIVCINVLEHIKRDNQALKNLYKLLKNDGHLILLVPAHSFLFGKIDQSIGHIRRYEKEELVNQLEGLGFTLLNCRKLNFLGAIGWFFAGRILKEAVLDDNKIKLFNIMAPVVLPLEDLIEPPIGTSILIIVQKVMP